MVGWVIVVTWEGAAGDAQFKVVLLFGWVGVCDGSD